MKTHLLTGFVILLPLALTVMIILFLFDFLTEPFVNIVGPLLSLTQSKLHFTLPLGLTLFISRVLALLLLCLFIFLLGVVTRWFIVKNLLSFGHQMISKIPVVKTVYKLFRDIFSAFFSTDGKKAFKHAVLIPFPERPNFCLGFQAGEVPEECQQKVDIPLVSVFAPTAPHPISGFLFLVDKKDVSHIHTSTEDAFKFLVSCGMIIPKEDHEA